MAEGKMDLKTDDDINDYEEFEAIREDEVELAKKGDTTSQTGFGRLLLNRVMGPRLGNKQTDAKSTNSTDTATCETIRQRRPILIDPTIDYDPENVS